MTVLAGIGFAAPWLLLGLLALPILWLILRAIPPAPKREVFPGVTLLLGLKDDETVSDRTPWWLLLLRMLAIAAIIIGLAGPVLNPTLGKGGDLPLLVVMDASWAGATRWKARLSLVDAQLAKAGHDGRQVAIVELSAPETPVFLSADVWRDRLTGLEPKSWQPTSDQIAQVIGSVAQIDAGFDTTWVGDGLDYDGRDALLEALEAKGAVEVFQNDASVMGLTPARIESGAIELTAIRSRPGPAREMTLLAQGRDPAGNARILADLTLRFAAGETQATANLSLPAELRARITRFEVKGQSSAGTTSLVDDGLRRREVAMIAGRDEREGLELLAPLHYLKQALIPSAHLLEGNLTDLLPANPDVIVLADVAVLTGTEEEALGAWVEAGGLLLRFAGPRLAASDLSRADENALMPVRLRAGGRSVGGAMSWGEPKTLAPFAEGSLFYGLQIPDDVRVTSQVVAQPDPTLADRVVAALSDGTPLVTRKALGQGQVVLFHVTANAEWSNLPLSGLFVEMLERLAVSSSAHQPVAADLAGTIWRPVEVLNGFGILTDAATLPGVAGPDLAEAPAGPDLRPGLYEDEGRTLARNVLGNGATLAVASWPARVTVRGLGVIGEVLLGGWLLALALVLLAVDVAASLALTGRLAGGAKVAALIAGGVMLLGPYGAQAQQNKDDTAFAIASTAELVLAHVVTGNKQVDEVALAGLSGLSDTLFFRTSIEPATPVGVDLERDELAFFPMLYWPITPDQPTPSQAAYAKLNTYLRSGGLILFDTRDSHIARFGASSPNGRKLQQLAADLDIPPLEQVPNDHVLTRAFYLLQDFPGRHNSRDVWVEAAPPDAQQVEGMPFRNLNDGVSPVVIGGNDWAGAWATDKDGRPMLPVGRGFAGERQREIAFRFGVNLVMHVLTGNYKSDQVHVPALLDRLGQ